MFRSDYPRGLVNWLRVRWLPASDPLPVALALDVPFPFARLRGSVSLLRLPPRPFPRRLLAARAAIALRCLSWVKALLTSFQQTQPCPRPARQTLPPTGLIFGMTCRTLRRAHGR